MPSRRLALVANHIGPVVAIKGVRQPIVRICGLPEGETLTVYMASNGVIREHPFSTNGDHSVADADCAQVSVDSKKRHRTLIVEIISKVA